MRVAVLVYGRLDKCIQQYDNIIEHIGRNHEVDFFFSSDESSEFLVNNFIKLYKPILYDNTKITYDYDLSKYQSSEQVSRVHNMTCHFINKNRVFALLEKHMQTNNVNYDVVISLRIDLQFENSFDFSELLDNTLYIPHNEDHGGINDRVAYGKVDVMKKYNSIDPVFLLEQKLSIIHPESLTLANIKFNELLVKRVDLKCNNIIR